MKRSLRQDEACDLVALNKDNIAFTGTARVKEITITTNLLPDPLTFPKSSIAYIHFKQLPYQPNDYIQLVSGGSVEGEIVKLPKLAFTVAENGQELTISRDVLLALMFFCSMDKAVSSHSKQRRKAARSRAAT